MRLTDLDPRWCGLGESHLGEGSERIRYGLTFLCPCCKEIRLGVFFEPYIDPGNNAWRIQWALPGGRDPDKPALHWHREGDTFETLTLTPSLNVSESGHWHGFITNGEVVSQ